MGDHEIRVLEDPCLRDEPFDAHMRWLDTEDRRVEVAPDRHQDLGLEAGETGEQPLEQVARGGVEDGTQGDVHTPPRSTSAEEGALTRSEVQGRCGQRDGRGRVAERRRERREDQPPRQHGELRIRRKAVLVPESSQGCCDQVGSQERSSRQHQNGRRRGAECLGRDGRAEICLVADDGVGLPGADVLSDRGGVAASALVGEVLRELQLRGPWVDLGERGQVPGRRAGVVCAQRAGREGGEAGGLDLPDQSPRTGNGHLVPGRRCGSGHRYQRMEVSPSADECEQDPHRWSTYLAASAGEPTPPRDVDQSHRPGGRVDPRTDRTGRRP